MGRYEIISSEPTTFERDAAATLAQMSEVQVCLFSVF
jgi:hypothetical protein